MEYIKPEDMEALKTVFGAAAKAAKTTIEQQNSQKERMRLENEKKDAAFSPFKTVYQALENLPQKDGKKFITDPDQIIKKMKTLAEGYEEHTQQMVEKDLRKIMEAPHSFIVSYEGSNQFCLLTMRDEKTILAREATIESLASPSRIFDLERDAKDPKTALKNLGEWIGQTAPDRLDDLARLASGTTTQTPRKAAMKP